ncbi:MAG: protein kinase [Gemmataceae bacterium]
MMNQDAVLDLIYQEITLRESHGEKPKFEEYSVRFPDLSEQLEILFEVEAALDPQALLEVGISINDQTDIGPSVPPPLHPSPLVPGYEVLGILGLGGMGVVYKARDTRLNRIVALKMLLAGTAAMTEQLTRFRLEAEALAQVQHPNIVQIFEVNEVNEQPYFVLEYVSGGSLSQRLNKNPVDEKEAAKFIEVLARAIHAAHQVGVIHRDLKPANILLSSLSEEEPTEKINSPSRTNEQSAMLAATFVEEKPPLDPLQQLTPVTQASVPGVKEPTLGLSEFTPKITDFGLAKMIREVDGMTVSGDFLGTPSYAAPEQALGNLHAIGPHTDVYALGAILYELLTGRPPFKAASILETLDLVRSSEPDSPRRYHRNIPKDLETICLKCLQKEPLRRYSSALTLAEDLTRFQRGEPVLARPVGPIATVIKWIRRKPSIAAAIGTVFLAAVVTIIVLWKSNVDLAAAASRERRQKEFAEESFRAALLAVDEMLTEVGDVELADIPQMGPVRKRLLRKAKLFHTKFLAKREDDPEVRYLAGRGYARLGMIEGLLGDEDAAEEALRRAIELLKQESASREVSIELAKAHHDLGVLLKTLKREREAISELETACRLKKANYDSVSPHESPDLRLDYSSSIYHLGAVLAKIPEQSDKAEAQYSAALKIQNELLQQLPKTQKYLAAVARSLNNYAILIRDQKPDDAETMLRRGLAIQQQLKKLNPDNPSYGRKLAEIRNNLGELAQHNSQYKEAESEYKQAIAIMERLVRDFPTIPHYQLRVAQISTNLGLLYEENKKPAEAIEYFRRSVRHYETLIREHPKVPEYRYWLGRGLCGVARRLESQRDLPEAMKYHKNAVVVFEKLIRQASTPRYESEYAMALHNYAKAGLSHSDENDVAAFRLASKLINKSVVHQTLAKKRSPSTTLYNKRLATHFDVLAFVNYTLTDHSACVRAAKGISTCYPEHATKCLRAANYIAWSVLFCDRDSKLTANQRIQTKKHYLRLTLEHLEAIVLLPDVDGDEVRASKALAVLSESEWKDDPRFQKLLLKVNNLPEAVDA